MDMAMLAAVLGLVVGIVAIICWWDMGDEDDSTKPWEWK